MSIYRLPHGQYAYSGHVINLPQNVLSFATSLPRLPKELDVLVVKKLQGDSHPHFRVRRTVVEEDINWLIQNNLLSEEPSEFKSACIGTVTRRWKSSRLKIYYNRVSKFR